MTDSYPILPIKSEEKEFDLPTVACFVCGKETIRGFEVVIADDEVMNPEFGERLGDERGYRPACPTCYLIVKGIFADSAGMMGVDLGHVRKLRGA